MVVKSNQVIEISMNLSDGGTSVWQNSRKFWKNIGIPLEKMVGLRWSNEVTARIKNMNEIEQRTVIRRTPWR
jgi:hypothetical protein